MKAILFRNGIEFKRTQYPRRDIGVIEDLSAGLEWKLIVENTIPVYDNRTHNLAVTENNTDTPHPVYTHLKQYTITYSPVRKSDSEIVEQIELAEEEANKLITNAKNRFKYIIIGMGILERKAQGQNITTKMQDVLDKITNKAINMWLNDDESTAKQAIANSGLTPDLDSDWNTDE